MQSTKMTELMLTEHCRKYGYAQIQDVFKFLFQSVFGCEHMISSQENAEKRIIEEANELNFNSSYLPEELDGDFCRVPLSVLSSGMSQRTLAKLFCLSAKESRGSVSLLESKLDIAEDLVCRSLLPFDVAEFRSAREKWKSEGYPAIHHSESFRREYRPSYRVISKKYLPLFPLFLRLDQFPHTVIAIDGGCASGKSTLSEILRELYGATVFHMDDYFLRPEQRTPQRLAEVGGNVDRERFEAEILKPLSENRPITYRRYDCSSASLCPPTTVTPKGISVIEGVYSMHPELSSYYDLSVFLDVSGKTQLSRIAKRESPALAARFAEEWIPMENIYFKEMKVKERCNIIIEVE